MKASLSDSVIKKIVDAEHHDPFSVLGMHPVSVEEKPGLAVRVFNPEARELFVLAEKGKRAQKKKMEKIHQEGLFEAIYAGKKDFFPYRLEICDAGGKLHELQDPYCFAPVLSDYDLHLFAEGNHHRIYRCLGAHPMSLNGVCGFFFAVWAPIARRVSVIGDFNRWDGRWHVMRARGSTGIWELFIPGLDSGRLYKYEIKAQDGSILVKADPYAFRTELRPKTASVTHDLSVHTWGDEEWVARRDKTDQLSGPISIYELHLGSWMRVSEEDNRSLTYREATPKLIEYVKEMGYTHVEFLPLAAHPFDPSWGYQVTGYFSATARYGPPEDLMWMIDQCHQNGIGVILDWVPAHFPTDAHALARFDGTCLYEHADPKQSLHPDWGTLVFNYGRNEVRNFLIANALFWLEEFHVDGLRVDAVASMIYLDYSRKEGEWVPNQYGGRENLEAIGFIKQLNEVVYSYHPGVLMIAEESTAWPSVSRPTYLGGLGFSLKWNMGWMHDMLEYISKEPIHRRFHHNMLTFALLYTFHENFVLPFSHDEVVHGKQALLAKMPGDDWQKFSNLRLLLGYMFGHPGKKHLFMGCDIGQWSEWDHSRSIEWHLLDYDRHRMLQSYVRELNRLYLSEPAMYELDFDPSGFEWIDFGDADSSLVSFIRRGRNPENALIFVFNFTPVLRRGYRIGLPSGGFYQEVLNSDSEQFWGSNAGNLGGVWSEAVPWHGQPHSAEMTIPPLSCLMFKPGGA